MMTLTSFYSVFCSVYSNVYYKIFQIIIFILLCVCKIYMIYMTQFICKFFEA